MLRQLSLQLDVELNQAEHSDRDRRALKACDPDMCESRAKTVLAIPVKNLGDHRDYREEDADEAVLEDAYPDDLHDGMSIQPFSHSHFSKDGYDIRTLNQVNPLLGFLNGPLFSPPVHFCTPKTPQNQFFGSIVLKKSFCSCKFGAI